MATVEEWFDRWWQDLPKHHFTSQNKGSKAECRKEVLKLAPDEELRDKIDWYTRELTLRTAKMKSMDIKVAGWKHAVRLIRYRFFEDDLPSISTAREKVVSSKCACGADTYIVDKCWACHDLTDKAVAERKQMLKDTFIKNGLLHDESKEERTKRCREFAVPRMARLLAQRGLDGNG